MTVIAGIAGTTNGSFFGYAPSFVDTSKLPGTSTQTLTSWTIWMKSSITARHLLYSPNLVWFLVTVFVYILFPYDMQQARTLEFHWIACRAALNLCVVSIYVACVVLGTSAWSSRKYRPDMTPSTMNMIHNVWYTTLGTLQWTVWEVTIVHLFAAGVLPWVPHSELTLTTTTGVWMIFREMLMIALVPLWRSFHFYWSHRLLHIPFIYRHVHSLHHRNVDIEPFAGLCMHPIEHLYYFSCLAPSLFLRLSPFQLLWNGMHLVLSPAASHSGWEDHVQSDQFHYVHHAKFNCNYGSGSLPLDRIFGSFVNVLYDEKTARKSEERAKRGEMSRAGAFRPKSTRSFQMYMLFTAVYCLFVLLVLFESPASDGEQHEAEQQQQHALFILFGNRMVSTAAKRHRRMTAFFVAFSPVLVAAFMSMVTGQRLFRPFSDVTMKGEGIASNYRLPSFLLHLAIGVAVGVFPVYALVSAALV